MTDRPVYSSFLERAIDNAKKPDRPALEAAHFLLDAYSKRRPTGDAEPYALIVARALISAARDAERLRAIVKAYEEAGRIGGYLREQGVEDQIKQNGELVRLRAVNAALLEALEALFEALELGPLECAAKYGPDVDHREFEPRAVEKARAAIALAKECK